MLYKILFIFALLSSVRSSPCNPAVELCRIHPQSGELTPVPQHQGGAGTGQNRVTDVCGVVGGDGTSCLGCDGQAYPNGGAPQFDACNVCGGDGTSCCGLGLCSNNGMCVDAKCICKRGWAGALCESPAVLCENVDCGETSGHGVCESNTGLCSCNDGWIGSACQMRNCFPNGAYDPETGGCTCMPGWGGDHCDACAKPADKHTNVCIAPYKLRSMRDLEAHVKLENGMVWRPNTEHEGVAYDCACIPHRPDPSQRSMARALNIVQLEEAFNELSRTAISRFTSTQSDLDAAVAEAQDYCEQQAGGVLRGTFFGIGVFIVTAIGMSVLLIIFVKFPAFGGISWGKK